MFLKSLKIVQNVSHYWKKLHLFIYLMQTSTEIVLQLIISYKIYSNKNKNKITWSTGLKQTIQMTKSPLTRHGIILLQTPMTETFSRQSRLQPIPEHIATHLCI
jgi:hypothetical protein